MFIIILLKNHVHTLYKTFAELLGLQKGLNTKKDPVTYNNNLLKHVSVGLLGYNTSTCTEIPTFQRNTRAETGLLEPRNEDMVSANKEAPYREKEWLSQERESGSLRNQKKNGIKVESDNVKGLCGD
jgi:hypothetical protein